MIFYKTLWAFPKDLWTATRMTASVGDKYFTPLATLMGVSVSPQSNKPSKYQGAQHKTISRLSF
jgi:hypothetical protein